VWRVAAVPGVRRGERADALAVRRAVHGRSARSGGKAIERRAQRPRAAACRAQGGPRRAAPPGGRSAQAAANAPGFLIETFTKHKTASLHKRLALFSGQDRDRPQGSPISPHNFHSHASGHHFAAPADRAIVMMGCLGGAITLLTVTLAAVVTGSSRLWLLLGPAGAVVLSYAAFRAWRLVASHGYFHQPADE